MKPYIFFKSKGHCSEKPHMNSMETISEARFVTVKSSARRANRRGELRAAGPVHTPGRPLSSAPLKAAPASESAPGRAWGALPRPLLLGSNSAVILSPGRHPSGHTSPGPSLAGAPGIGSHVCLFLGCHLLLARNSLEKWGKFSSVPFQSP